MTDQPAVDLVDELFASFTTHAGRPALNGETHAQLHERVRCLIGGLRDAGFSPGDRLLFSIRPNPDGLALVLATIAAGGTIVFFDPGMGRELFRSRVRLVEPTWTATESVLYALSLPGPGRLLAWRTGLTLPQIGSLDAKHFYYGHRWPGVPRRARPLRHLNAARGAGPVLTSPSSEALIVFTSGTTGDPKGVVHTRSSLGAGMSTAAEQFTADTVVHTDQLMIGIPALLAGAHWRMPRFKMRARVDPRRLAKEISGATDTFMVPADLPDFLDAVESTSVEVPPSLRRILLGGAPVPPQLLRRASVTLPDVELIAIYGMTEILPVAIAQAEDKAQHQGPGDPVGRPCDGVKARVTQEGELVLSGPALCRGYLGKEPMVEHHTGDRATISPGGGIVLQGRIKDMLLRGKTNIYPGLYEPAINEIPGVGQALLVGVPDRYGDDIVVLALTRDQEKVISHLEERVRRGLRDVVDQAAQPDHIVVVDSIPTQGRSRKPDRNALRELVREQLGLE